ncbi:hypothetical protein LBMAG42_40460 [Deltaproteobacteria bacterium]|nr:hypothetical protein LBMAG42_40460 [Deltaproteobacteria bacterium]
MSLKSRVDRLLGVGPSDDPRVIAVASKRTRVETPVVSTPGARLRVERTGNDGELGRLVLWCHRRGVPMELVEGTEDRVILDGEAATVAEVRRRLG